MEATLAVRKPLRIAIVNRGFWPIYPVIGEGLLKFAEMAHSDGNLVSVISQGGEDLLESLRKRSRGTGISYYPTQALANSSSRIIRRILDSLFFTVHVLIKLTLIRPDRVYVSTDPPIIVPFVIMIYCKVFGASYFYHLQDIHPEATQVVIPLNKWFRFCLTRFDSMTMCQATSIITITEQMAHEILKRSRTRSKVHIVSNPAISFDRADLKMKKVLGFAFCGNAGRLQRIPLVLEAIETYLLKGGQLSFTFAGGGVYENQLKMFANNFSNFEYMGKVDTVKAAEICAKYSWALLPIEDEVTKFAFPSKTSTYALAGARILAICGIDTSVARWVIDNKLGTVVSPNVGDLVSFFFQIERGSSKGELPLPPNHDLKQKLSLDRFAEELTTIVCR